MDSYHRPQSIYDLVGDPTVDEAPILHATPPRDTLVPGLLTLVFSASVFTVLLVCPDFLLKGGVLNAPGNPSESSRRTDILLDTDYPQLAPAPVSASGSGQPGGGNGAIDPRLKNLVVSNIPANLFPPEDLQNIRYPDRMALAGDPSLPVVPGGDGFRKGHGEGTLGSAGAAYSRTTSPAAKVEMVSKYDYQLVPTRTAPVQYTYSPEEMRELVATPLIVVVTVGADGKVIRARAKSGPKQLFDSAVKIALQWTFEPLAEHGLKAPIEADIRFLPHLVSGFK
jgi:hypothetical protein